MNQNFGFTNSNNMPLETYDYDDLSIDKINWAVTRDYHDIAKDHCGAVLVTNLAIYFANQGQLSILVDNDKYKTFNAVHTIVGNGPVATVASKAKKYFSHRGYSLRYKKVSSFDNIKTTISNNRPLGVLLTNGITSWHWVMAIGWRQYDTGEKYLRIVDGWNNTDEKFYKININSVLWSATEYWIK